MKKIKKYTSPEDYIVVNQDGEVFTGMRGGQFQYSPDWSNAKPLAKSSTYYLMRVKGNELIKENEL